jgi:hypothetical protein
MCRVDRNSHSCPPPLLLPFQCHPLDLTRALLLILPQGPWEPTTDLVQTIISDVKPELFTVHSKTLLTVYWEALTSRGVSKVEVRVKGLRFSGA